jgi:hypothetical protein
MNIAQKTQAVVGVLLATVLLAGCTATASAKDTTAPSTDGVSNSAETSTPSTDKSAVKISEERFEASLAGNPKNIEVVEVLDPRTFLVEAGALSAKANNYAGQIPISISADLGIVTPALGECGYDESLAFAKQYFAENPTDMKVKNGDFTSFAYFWAATEAGLAYSDDNYSSLSAPKMDAENAKAGLWTLCPGFGE